jgi:hypothetical protein
MKRLWCEGEGIALVEEEKWGESVEAGGEAMGLRNRKGVLREIQKLAQSRANDAVKLAFMSGEELEGLEGLDLSAVTEFKRNSNGTVELKFVDRLAALQWLLERVGEDPQAQELRRALEGSAERMREREL